MFHSLYTRASALPAEQTPDKAFAAWPATYLDGLQTFDPEHWQLEVSGLVGRPQQFDLKALNQFMRIQQNRRLVFADGWTYRAQWEGFVVQELLHRVAPAPEAQYLIQTDLSGHVECLPLRDLINQRALFCLRVDGQNLPALYGGPLRLLVFDRYAHKGLGQLSRLELAAEPVPGFFASKGYDPDAPILPGDYYAADLKSMQAIRNPGEVTHF